MLTEECESVLTVNSALESDYSRRTWRMSPIITP